MSPPSFRTLCLRFVRIRVAHEQQHATGQVHQATSALHQLLGQRLQLLLGSQL